MRSGSGDHQERHCGIKCLSGRHSASAAVWRPFGESGRHEPAHSKLCGLSSVTGSGFLERDFAVEFLRHIFMAL